MAFVHLHNHTEYSLLDGTTHIMDIVNRAADLGMPAVAITDHGVMSGVPELCAACDAVKAKRGIEVKPIYGCEVYFTEDETLAKDGRVKLNHLLLLAKNNTGYKNLIKLVSESHVDNFYRKPRTTLPMLRKYGEGIIGSSACIAGIIPQALEAGNFEKAVYWAKTYASCFAPGDFYIELQNQFIKTDAGTTQVALNRQLVEVAKAAGLKCIATNDFHYLTHEDARQQDIMLCIGTGSNFDDEKRLRFQSDQFYMKTEEEMREALSEFPEACDNTIEVADKCNVVLDRTSILPRFPLPEGETEESYFRKQCEDGLKKRYGDPVPKNIWDQYEYEASVILKAGFPAYFLIVQEYISWARSQGIGVGPGRGSAAGAVVAYAMGITDIEPISNGLMFERFLSPERVEMPDIDVDFEDERRQEVIEHIKDVYGEDHVSGVITFGKLQAKNAVRDTARVLGYPYNTGDRICKMIGDELGITIAEALEKNPEFKAAYDSEEDVKAIVDDAMTIEGHVRGEGVHACATIICRDPMTDHVPVKRDTKGGSIITQYDGHYTPDLGLLKMDFLGLRTLGVLSRACNNIKDIYGITIVPEEIPIDDEDAFKLMQGGNMDGLFQVESALYVSLFSKLPPKRFSDIVASIALNRPGPLESGMVDDYVQVASGKKPVHYYDERLKPILEETYGTMVYQEQIMQVSIHMSGFSAGRSDVLRKAMGKKKIDVMNMLQAEWDEGAVKNGYKLEVAQEIWADALKFAKYAFNKSHSAAYAVLVMRTAYLKAHYPNEYMAAVLSSYMGNTDRLIRYIASCNHSGIKVLPPDINSSNVEFTPVDEGIRFGLVGVRGIGNNVAEEIVRERKENGPYSSLHDFVSRLDSKCYNRKTLEALIKGGAFDSTGYTRKQLMYFVDETSLLENASKRQKDKDLGQTSMFDLFDSDDEDFKEEIPAPDGIEWDKRQKLAYEKEIMKIYVSEHPLTPYENAIAKMSKYKLSDLAERTTDIKSATFVGLVSSVVTKLTKTGNKMATFTLEDTTGHVECICFKYSDYADCIYEDAIIKVKGKFEHSDRGNQVIVYEAELVEFANQSERIQNVEIHVSSSEFNQDTSLKLNHILKTYPGASPVYLIYSQVDGKRFKAALPVCVDAKSAMLKMEIERLFGHDNFFVQ
jgi:DNA polymerase III subunit alpha